MSAPSLQTAPSLQALLQRGTPFLDVRSPAEAARGTVPGAENLPILDDEERHQVGLTFKQSGHDAAESLGFQLVSGQRRERRIAAWTDFARRHPDAWIFCWRGGQRSQIAQAWLEQAGRQLPRVEGGFKALRHACLETLSRAPSQLRWIVLGGRTGSGKTELLKELPTSIDLEGLAAHRGSAFGATADPQPPPVTFENALAVSFLKRVAGADAGDALVLEDESRTIGRLAVPESWHIQMQRSPLVILEVPMPERCANIVREYVSEPLARGIPSDVLHARYTDALGRIERRLGGARRAAVQNALDTGFADGDHATWVQMLLEAYYDPLYDYQLSRKQERVQLRGGWDEVRDFLSSF